MFGRFLLASGLANLADGVALLAWVWVASMLTRDPGLIALVPMVLRLPWPLFAIPAGLVADRVDRRRLVVAMDLLRAFAFAGAALALWFASPLPSAPLAGVSSIPLFVGLCLAALTVGVAEVFRDNAAQTLLPALVSSQDLEKANGRLWTVEAVANQLTGPALGAVLLGTLVAAPFMANALAYGLAGLMMAAIAGRFTPERQTGSHWRADLAEAFGFMRRQPLLLWLACITGLWNLGDAMMVFSLVLHAQENIGLTAPQYGGILAAAAVGGMAAGLLGGWFPGRIGASLTARLMCIFATLAYVAMAAVPSGLWLAGCYVVLEFCGITWNIVSVSTRQRLIPPDLLGRVNSLYRLLAWGMLPLGTLLAGLIISHAAPVIGRAEALTLPIWIGGSGLLLVMLVAQAPLRRYLPGRTA
ncbi:MAG TPA: MFS transporter [Gemmobacter sp.]|nr:MFS transporter [Gemmobacter sp.]